MHLGATRSRFQMIYCCDDSAALCIIRTAEVGEEVMISVDFSVFSLDSLVAQLSSPPSHEVSSSWTTVAHFRDNYFWKLHPTSDIFQHLNWPIPWNHAWKSLLVIYIYSPNKCFGLFVYKSPYRLFFTYARTLFFTYSVYFSQDFYFLLYIFRTFAHFSHFCIFAHFTDFVIDVAMVSDRNHSVGSWIVYEHFLAAASFASQN